MYRIYLSCLWEYPTEKNTCVHVLFLLTFIQEVAGGPFVRLLFTITSVSVTLSSYYKISDLNLDCMMSWISATHVTYLIVTSSAVTLCFNYLGTTKHPRARDATSLGPWLSAIAWPLFSLLDLVTMLPRE
eukprot:Rmarinus@m.22226